MNDEIKNKDKENNKTNGSLKKYDLLERKFYFDNGEYEKLEREKKLFYLRSKILFNIN